MHKHRGTPRRVGRYDRAARNARSPCSLFRVPCSADPRFRNTARVPGRPVPLRAPEPTRKVLRRRKYLGLLAVSASIGASQATSGCTPEHRAVLGGPGQPPQAKGGRWEVVRVVYGC